MRAFLKVRFYKFQEMVPLLRNFQVGAELTVSAKVAESVKALEVEKVRRILEAEGMQCCIHAPYLHLNLAALDKDILEVSRKKVERAARIASDLNAVRFVVHSFYSDYNYDFRADIWLKVMSESVERLLNILGSEGPLIVIENVFDTTPRAIRMLMEEFNGQIGFCFDVGHANMLSTVSWKTWIRQLKKFIKHVHLHDNNGTRDQHLPPGRGTVPFETELNFLKKMDDVTVTAEPNDPSLVKAFLKFLKNWAGR